jgi:hypothetical protein
MNLQRFRILVVLAAIVLPLVGPACESATSGNTPSGARGDRRVRQQCSPRGHRVQTVDVNNDNHPDIRHVYAGRRETCVQIDMNFDGMVDITRFFDDHHRIVQEEHDFDFDGRLDQIAYFEHGDLVRKELDTNFDNSIDTWVWCDGRMLDRQERDRHHNGHVDTWEFFRHGVLREARYDDNNDRRPERWELFREGRLYEVRRDADLDGRPDQREQIPTDSAGQAETPLTCDGSAPPPPPQATPRARAGRDGGALARPNDRGTPWEGVSDVLVDGGAQAVDAGVPRGGR